MQLYVILLAVIYKIVRYLIKLAQLIILNKAKGKWLISLFTVQDSEHVSEFNNVQIAFLFIMMIATFD